MSLQIFFFGDSSFESTKGQISATVYTIAEQTLHIIEMPYEIMCATFILEHIMPSANIQDINIARRSVVHDCI